MRASLSSALSLALLAPLLASGSIIASSQLEQCVQTGTDANGLACVSSMFVVALSVENGQNGTETVEATMSQATDSTGTHKLESPWRIVLRKSKIVIRYPIRYVRSFNARPTEQTIVRPTFGCVDGSEASAPTCGWAVVNGVRVPSSQGFCCACSFSQTIGLSDQSTRSSALTCDLFSSQEAASCLTFGDLWYSTYEVGAAETHFSLDVGITSYVVDPSTSQLVAKQEVLTLGPTSPGARSSDCKIIARLLGDFAKPAETPTLSSKYLVVPSSPTNSARVLAGSAEWMLIDRSLFSLDGTECNKIGVSYSAFQHQAEKCNQRLGSCLGGQIDDLRASDVALTAQKRTPMFNVSAFGSFYHLHGATSSDNYVAYNWPGMQASVLTLEMAADGVRFVINNAPGEIDQAQVEGFEAGSADGKLTVRFTNTGSVTSDFTVTVDCSSGAPSIKPVDAQRASVRPYVSQTFEFALRSETTVASTNTCIVKLFDSLNTVTDSKVTGFSTTALVDLKGAQDGDVVGRGVATSEGASGAAGASGGVLGAGGSLGKDALCSRQCGFFDVKCLFLLRCWSALGRLVGVLVGTICCLVVLKVALSNPRFRAALHKLVCACSLANARQEEDSRERARKAERRSRPRDDRRLPGWEHSEAEEEGREQAPLPSAVALPQRRSAAAPQPMLGGRDPTPTRALQVPTAERDYEGALKPSLLTAPLSSNEAVDQGLLAHRLPGDKPSAWEGHVYLNLRTRPGMQVALKAPGTCFSLRGELVRRGTSVDQHVGGGSSSSSSIEFRLAPQPAFQYFVWDAEVGRHVSLAQPAALDASRLVFQLNQVQLVAIVSAAPKFACLNEAPPPEHTMRV